MTHDPIPMKASKGNPLKGTAKIPGDKSISHRALILGAMAVGETQITGLLNGDDVQNTARAMSAFGAQIQQNKIHGLGVGGFMEPETVIDCGNAGTGVRLIMGAMATTPIAATFTGDASLRSRPMGRITAPLAEFGAQSFGRAGGFLPLTMIGAKTPAPIHYTTPHASAQIKSAVLLAALNVRGESVVIEPAKTRDHTERMLKGFGAEIETFEKDGAWHIHLQGQPELTAQKLSVPADPSSAAFPMVAALLVENSQILLPNISMNPTRTGLLTTLIEMGADIVFENERVEGGEAFADLRVSASALSGVEVPPDRAPSMIDEYPILSVVAAFSSGKTVMRGIGELRIKESDRIAAMADGLVAMGIKVEQGEDWMIVHGGAVRGGISVKTHFDHRIAMSFLVMGLVADAPITVDDGSAIATSFPVFESLMCGLGADIVRVAV